MTNRFQVTIETQDGVDNMSAQQVEGAIMADYIGQGLPTDDMVKVTVFKEYLPPPNTMAGKLNRLGVVPTIEKGQIVGLRANLWFGGTVLDEIHLNDKQLRWMGVDPEDIGHLEACQMGSGNYRPRLTAGPILTEDGWYNE